MQSVVAFGVQTDAPAVVVVKLPGFTLKKTFVAHETRTRAWLEATLGAVTVAVPEFGTAEARTWEKVLPPSVESAIFTVLQLTGAAPVPAGFHATVWLVPPVHVMPAAGCVTANGPEEATASVTDA